PNRHVSPAHSPAHRQRKDPATTGTWATGMDKGFVGGTQDPTGLIHLNAREYDPFIGRFISVDPVIDLTDPQQWNAYAYGNNNPVSFSDPSGLTPIALFAIPVAQTLGLLAVGSIAIVAIGACIENCSTAVEATSSWVKDQWASLTGAAGATTTISGTIRAVHSESSAGGARVVDSDGNEIESPDEIAQKIKQFTEQALAEWENGELGLDETQNEAIRTARNPAALGNALKGSILDDRVKELVESDPELSSKLFPAGKGVYGPDWVKVETGGTKGWYDLTTRGDWRKHVNKYTAKLGKGVGIIWNSSRSHTSGRASQRGGHLEF
ncbi:RHS repeat-associated core domain-containing protein, partial [Micromonospora sp. LOL_024]|uniref:RHS repeat-associated core domain-containing protein n=1 Tax=Micromonospora sp. LOL_024 TaxID=3345412 RepID=UPI003A86867E